MRTRQRTTADSRDNAIAAEPGEGSDDYALHYVPVQARTGKGSLLMAYYALVGSLFFLITGALVALTVGTEDALIGIAISSLFQGAVCWYLMRYAIRSGVSTSLFSRAMFGTTGSALAALLLGGTAIFYGTFESSVIAVAFSSYVGGPVKLWYGIIAAFSVLLVLGGVRKWLDRLNGVLMPLYAVGLIGAVVWTAVKYHPGSYWLSYTPVKDAIPGPHILFAVVTYMGVMVLTMYSWDYARFAREKDSTFHRTITFGPVYYLLAYLLNATIGIFLVLVIPTKGAPSEISVVFDLLGVMGLAGLLFIWVSQTRINTANFYVASINVESFLARAFRLKVPRVVGAIIAGGIAFILMLANVFSYLDQALAYQAVFIVAWVALACAHVATTARPGDVDRRGDWRPSRLPAVNVGGTAAWFLASGVGVVLLKVVGGTWGAWSSPITFVIGFAAYGLWMQLPAAARTVRSGGADPRVGVADPRTTTVHCAVCGGVYAVLEMDTVNGVGLACSECALNLSGARRVQPDRAAAASPEMPAAPTPVPNES